MRLTLSRFGSILVQDQGLVWDDTLRHRQIPLDPSSLQAIHLFSTEPTQMADPEMAGSRTAPELLVALKSLEVVLEVDGSRYREEVSLLDTWGRWSTQTRLYNFSTRIESTDNVVPPAEANAWLVERGERDAAPARFVDTEPGALALPTEVREVTRRDFDDVLSQRRTVRRFERREIDLRTISTLLKKSVALSDVRQRSNGDQKYMNFFRSAPSAGARASTEVYLIALSVEGVSSGCYRYNPASHSILLVGESPSLESLDYALGGQSWLLDCPALLVYSVNLPSLMWKYPHGRTYRVGLLDVGHISQSVIMTAWALNLGSNFTAFFREQALESSLAIDPGSEVLAGVCGLGYAADDDPQTQGVHE